MRIDPRTHLRIARPTSNLTALERFWCTGLGLEVLFRSEAHGNDTHALLMVGWPAAAWHLELVADAEAAARSTPTEEDLLVLYLGDAGAVRSHVDQLLAAGGRRVAARNPYWETWGRTVEDPDGYRIVLSDRTWG